MIELHNRGQVPFENLMDEPHNVPGSDAQKATRSAFETFRGSRYAERQPRWIEAAIDIRLAAGRVRGRIDAVYEELNGSWEIVDFKSGRRSTDPARYVQLEAYAIAAADGALGPSPPDKISVTFVYLGGDTLETEEQIVDTEWLQAARHHLQQLTESAKRQEYEPTPGTGCRNCDFVSFCEEGREYLGALSQTLTP